MRQRKVRGGAAIEFAFVLLVLIPLLLGTGAVGVNLVRTLQTVPTGSGCGTHVRTRSGFLPAGQQDDLVIGGREPGTDDQHQHLHGRGDSFALTYVDDSACTAAGAATGGVHNSSCTNYGKWVFTQRLADRQ